MLNDVGPAINDRVESKGWFVAAGFDRIETSFAPEFEWLKVIARRC